MTWGSTRGTNCETFVNAKSVRVKKDAEEVDVSSRKKALQVLPYGLFVVGCSNQGNVSTILVNWVTQVSFDPPLVAVSIEKGSKMQRDISESGLFSLNMLPAGGKEIARSFIKPTRIVSGTINGRGFSLSKRQMPILDDARAALECTVVQTVATGDHVTYVGEVTDALVREDGEVLTLKETGLHYHK